ncbi:MCE family protein [Nocardioides panacisoli]|uniref:MCE family protein n=1 Tax=Nocardioides panacisoli TaxID=627624 RepID=A0ABP7J4Y6_9ACTN
MAKTLWSRIDRRVVIVILVLLVVGVGVNILRSPQKMMTVTAHFPRAVAVYKGTDVRILGVTVGQVTAVEPEGNSVRVEMEYDADYKVPKDAKAVIVTPTLVADRYVQLTPVYTDGAVMADGADIALPETGVPVELDRIYSSLLSLTQALGPNGINKDGTLNHVLQAGRKALEGQGTAGNEMIQQLSQAAQTFGEGAGPLFDTVTQLASFTETLAGNDKLVRAFMKDLAGVSRMLAAESSDLKGAVASVARAVGSVQSFVHDNRDALAHNIKQLTTVMTTISSESGNLDTALRIAPVALGNLALGQDPTTHTQNSRVDIAGNIWGLDGIICSVIMQKPGMPLALKNAACNLIKRILRPILDKLPNIPPEYDQYLPKGQVKDTRNGFTLPESGADVTYSTVDDPSLTSMLGGTP